MYAKVVNVFVYLFGAWLLSGRFLISLALAAAVSIAAAVDYGWSTIQFFGATLLIVAFLKTAGLLPFWPA